MNKQEQVQQMTTYMANFVSHIAKVLPDDIIAKLDELGAQEDAPLSKVIYETMKRNQKLAKELNCPSCQDTGVLQFWVKCGVDFPLIGEVEGLLKEAVVKSTFEAPLRHNSVETFDEFNTGRNVGKGTPTVWWDIVPNSDKCEIYAYMAGGGCTLPGKAMVLMPGAGYEGVTKFVMDVMTSYGIPMLTIAILYMTFVGYKLMPDIPNEQFSDAAHTASESEKLSPFKRKLAVLIVLVSIAMMLLENVIGVKMYLTSCIGAAALVLTGVLTEREALNSIHQPTIFLFAGVLALSDAIQTTGAGDVVADWMIRLLGDTTNPYIIMLVFFLVPFILTQVMSNLATLTIFIPLVTSACIRMGVDPRAAVVGVITASCVSIMTPMAAPCQIMIIEPGGYTLKDYLKCGTPLALILIVVSVFFLPTLYPFA